MLDAFCLSLLEMLDDETKAVLEEIGVDATELLSSQDISEVSDDSSLHPLAAIGLGSFFVCNLALLLSLPPVLRGKGAPYLPTFQKNLESMFTLLKRQPTLQKQLVRGDKLEFADLGSGDGRIVFHAAREGIFTRCIGYELNPLLYAYSNGRRLAGGSHVRSKTFFHCRDLWKVDLGQTNVVAVYGLGPIMSNLQSKLRDELPNNSFILSNIFTFPGWKPTDSIGKTYLYKTPDCWSNPQQGPNP